MTIHVQGLGDQPVFFEYDDEKIEEAFIGSRVASSVARGAKFHFRTTRIPESGELTLLLTPFFLFRADEVHVTCDPSDAVVRIMDVKIGVDLHPAEPSEELTIKRRFDTVRPGILIALRVVGPVGTEIRAHLVGDCIQ